MPASHRIMWPVPPISWTPSSPSPHTPPPPPLHRLLQPPASSPRGRKLIRRSWIRSPSLLVTWGTWGTCPCQLTHCRGPVPSSDTLRCKFNDTSVQCFAWRYGASTLKLYAEKCVKSWEGLGMRLRTHHYCTELLLAGVPLPPVERTSLF